MREEPLTVSLSLFCYLNIYAAPYHHHFVRLFEMNLFWISSVQKKKILFFCFRNSLDTRIEETKFQTQVSFFIFPHFIFL